MNADHPQEDPSQAEEEFSVFGLMAAHAMMGDSLTTLYSWNHSPEKDLNVSGDPETAMQSLDMIRRFYAGMDLSSMEEERKQSIGETLATITAAIKGFRFRQEHELPGIGVQSDHIYRALYDGAVDVAGKRMELFMAQADVPQEMIAQIHTEYQHIMQVREDGGDPDVRRIRYRISDLHTGLDFLSVEECTDLLRQLRSYAHDLELAAPLVAVQGKWQMSVWQSATEGIDRLKNSVTRRVIDSIDLHADHVSRAPWYEDEPQPPKDATVAGRIRWEYNRLYEALSVAGDPPHTTQGWEARLQEAKLAENLYETVHQELTTQLERARGERWNRALSLFKRQSATVSTLTTALRQLEQQHTDNRKLLEYESYFLGAERFISMLAEVVLPTSVGEEKDRPS